MTVPIGDWGFHSFVEVGTIDEETYPEQFFKTFSFFPKLLLILAVTRWKSLCVLALAEQDPHKTEIVEGQTGVQGGRICPGSQSLVSSDIGRGLAYTWPTPMTSG